MKTMTLGCHPEIANGTKFRVINYIGNFPKGSIVELDDNDGSVCPWFTLPGAVGSSPISWEDLAPVESWDALASGDVLIDEEGDEWQVADALEKVIFVVWDGKCYMRLKTEVQACGWTIKSEQTDKIAELTLEEIADKFGIGIDRLRIKKEDN